MTAEEVTPLLNKTKLQLENTEDSIADAIRMVSEIQYLQDGFEEVSTNGEKHCI